MTSQLERFREGARRVGASDPMAYRICPRCDGTGQEPGVPEPHICAQCPGSGVPPPQT